MTLAVGGIPTAQLPAVPSNHPARPPTPPPRHCPRRNFQILRDPPHPHMSLPMERPPASPPLSHLPLSSETFTNSSPPPPPPPPVYTISELPVADLPPPPPLTLWQEMTSPCYMCCYDPPSPEVKSEYDPKLPPGFFFKPDIFPSSPPPPPVPPPPRPSFPCHSTPPVREMCGASSPPNNATTYSDTLALHPETAVESGGCEDQSIETCSTSSLMSSSTLTASYFQTPDSVSSPLPPHALRVSPLSNDDVTLSSQVSSDCITPSTDVSLTPTNFLSGSQEHTLCSNTSKLLPHASELTETLYDASLSPDPPLAFLFVAPKVEQQGSSTQTPETYTRMESIKSEDGSFIPSEVSCTTTDTVGPAIMSSPLSTDTPSLPSLPTDMDSVSSGIGSLTTDTWSFSTEVDFQPEDVSILRTNSYNSSASDTPYTIDESEAVSPVFTGSCIITPMPSDYLTPLFSSPAPTPVPSPLPSSPLPYLYKSASPLDSGSITPQGMASSQLSQVSNGEYSSLFSSGFPTTQENPIEHTSSCYSFNPPQSCLSDLFASQPPSSLVTEQCINHTKENSASTQILNNLNQLNTDINSPLQITSFENKTDSLEVPHNTTSLEHEPDHITQVQRNDVIAKEENVKECNSNEGENGESTDDQKQDGKDSVVETQCKEEGNPNEGVGDTMECRENNDNHVMKDVNGNISYLGVEDGQETLMKNGEDVCESRPEAEPIQTQTMIPGTIQPGEEVLKRKAESDENICLEALKVPSPHSSLVLSPSLAHSPGPCTITPSLPYTPSSHTLHLSSHNEATLNNVRATSSSHNGTSSTFTHCSTTSPNEALDLLDAMVINLENMSADLPASPTSRLPDLTLSQAAPVTTLNVEDHHVTDIPAISNMAHVGHSQDGKPQELKVEGCHLSKSAFISASPPHPTPISPPALSSPVIPPSPIIPPHASMSAYFSKPSSCVCSPCPSLTTSTVNPAHSVSPTSRNVPHLHPHPLPSFSPQSSGDQTNTTLLEKDDSESASKDDVLSCSHWTDLQDSLPFECGTSLPSLCSSPKPSSLLDGQPSPSPAPRSRTPPTPPPRSCHNTPRSHLAPPPPPVRQYMLVPINHTSSRQPSPPPAPPRSTSVRKSSPPPPPRPAVPYLPPPVQEWIKGPPLPPPPVSSSFTPPHPALTPVPEESSNPQSPVPSKSPQLSSPSSEDVSSRTMVSPDSLGTHHQLPSLPPPLPCTSDDPPALPPPPQDTQEDEDLPPPPPPPPPIELNEAAPPLPLPPPPPQVLFSPSSPLFFTLGKDEPSNPIHPWQEPALPGMCVSASHTNLSSTPSSDPGLPPPAVDAVAISPPPQIHNITASLRSPMSNSEAVDAATASSPQPLIPAPLHAPPSSPPLPPCSPGANMDKAPKSPLITTSPYGKMVVVRSDIPLPTPEEEVRVTFIASKDWGFMAQNENTLSVYTQLRPIIQQGPQ